MWENSLEIWPQEEGSFEYALTTVRHRVEEHVTKSITYFKAIQLTSQSQAFHSCTVSTPKHCLYQKAPAPWAHSCCLAGRQSMARSRNPPQRSPMSLDLVALQSHQLSQLYPSQQAEKKIKDLTKAMTQHSQRVTSIFA